MLGLVWFDLILGTELIPVGGTHHKHTHKEMPPQNHHIVSSVVKITKQSDKTGEGGGRGCH